MITLQKAVRPLPVRAATMTTSTTTNDDGDDVKGQMKYVKMVYFKYTIFSDHTRYMYVPLFYKASNTMHWKPLCVCVCKTKIVFMLSLLRAIIFIVAWMNGDVRFCRCHYHRWLCVCVCVCCCFCSRSIWITSNSNRSFGWWWWNECVWPLHVSINIYMHK